MSPTRQPSEASTHIVAPRSLLLASRTTASTPNPRRQHIHPNEYSNSSDNKIDNTLVAIYPSDYTGLRIQCLTFVHCFDPEGFAARDEKVAQGYCCRYQRYQLVVPLED
jgi:hypothetical protein